MEILKYFLAALQASQQPGHDSPQVQAKYSWLKKRGQLESLPYSRHLETFSSQMSLKVDAGT